MYWIEAQNVGVVPHSRPGLVSRSVRRAPPASSFRLAPIRSRLAAMSAAFQWQGTMLGAGSRVKSGGSLA
jgi:hypothetical protein